MASLSPQHPPEVATDGRFSSRTTTREFVVCIVLSAIVHGVFVWMFRLPSDAVSPEHVTTAPTIEVSLTTSVVHDDVTQEQRNNETEPSSALDETEEDIEAEENQIPAPASPGTPQHTTNEPPVEKQAADVMNRLQRYRWFDRPRLIDVPDDTGSNEVRLGRLEGPPLGAVNVVALPFDAPRFDLVDDQTGCDAIRKTEETDGDPGPGRDTTRLQARTIGRAEHNEARQPGSLWRACVDSVAFGANVTAKYRRNLRIQSVRTWCCHSWLSPEPAGSRSSVLRTFRLPCERCSPPHGHDLLV